MRLLYVEPGLCVNISQVVRICVDGTWNEPTRIVAEDESERAESIKVGTGERNEPESTRPRPGAAGGDDNRHQPPDPHRPD